jgi:hypothetical protein
MRAVSCSDLFEDRRNTQKPRQTRCVLRGFLRASNVA